MKYIRLFFIVICAALSSSLCFGQTGWVKINNPVTERLVAIDFLTPDSGYVLGVNSLFFTFDGGMTWSARTIPTVYNDDIHFFSVLEGLVISGNQLFRTKDGGNTWVEKIIPMFRKNGHNDHLTKFSFTYSNHAFGYIACGSPVDTGALLPFTTDKGHDLECTSCHFI